MGKFTLSDDSSSKHEIGLAFKTRLEALDRLRSEGSGRLVIARDDVSHWSHAGFAAARNHYCPAEPHAAKLTGRNLHGVCPPMTIKFDAAPPQGAESLAVPWITVPVSNMGILPCAVIKPSGKGPFPTVVLLHGSHGFAGEYVQLARDLARSGFLTLAAGWFREGSGPGLRFITPIICADAPPRPDPLSSEVLHLVDALVQAARTLPDALGNRLALFGHSRGGGAVLNYVIRTRGIQAAVLSSSRYPIALRPLCRELNTPLLMLHGTDDRPEDGGTEFTTIEMARAFDQQLRLHAKTVEAVYYPGGRHNDIFADKQRYADELSHMRAFLTKYLTPA